jgi:ribosomal protein L11 methyltransferase
VLTVVAGGTADAELVSAELWSAGCTAITESERAGTVTLTAGFRSRGEAEAARRRLGRADAVTSEEADDAWVDPWRRASRPTVVGPFVVRAPWHPARPGAGQELVIDPGPAFGHGGHPTTRLVLDRLAPLVGAGTSVLDVGSGSGVLAVAAAALGAGPVVAVDIDPAAVAATRANARANGVAVDARPGTVDGEVDVFDVVLANLLAPTLQELAGSLVAAVAPGGLLVVSGLLVEQRDAVVATLSPLVVVGEAADDGWAVLELGRSPREAMTPGRG